METKPGLDKPTNSEAYSSFRNDLMQVIIVIGLKDRLNTWNGNKTWKLGSLELRWAVLDSDLIQRQAEIFGTTNNRHPNNSRLAILPGLLRKFRKLATSREKIQIAFWVHEKLSDLIVDTMHITQHDVSPNSLPNFMAKPAATNNYK